MCLDVAFMEVYCGLFLVEFRDNEWCRNLIVYDAHHVFKFELF